MGDLMSDAVRDGLALGLVNGAIYGFFGGLAILVASVVHAKNRGE